MKSNEYDIPYIRKYLNGELDARSMYKLERQAQDDPLLMDLILGMESGDQNEHEGAIRDIDGMIRQRTEAKKPRIVPLFRWSIAASFLIICSITAWFILNRQQSAPMTAVNRTAIPGQEKKLPVIRPADTIKASGQSTEPSDLSTGASDQSTLLAKLPEKPPIKTADSWPALVEQEPKVSLAGEEKKSDSVKLHEVRITGYAALAKRNLALSAVPLPIPENNVQQSLQGRVAGVTVMRGMRINPGQTVTGVVMDKQDNSALPGVLVSVKGSGNSTLTDKDGRFQITVPGRSDSLELSYVGFKKKSLRVGDGDSVTIAMAPSEQSLNEVVVVGYGAEKRMDSQDTGDQETEVRPLNGWRNFNKYIKEHAVAEKGAKGVVIVTFYVSADGQPGDFKIIKSSNDTIKGKAVKLLKEGPPWKGPANGSRKVRLRISFNENTH